MPDPLSRTEALERAAARSFGPMRHASPPVGWRKRGSDYEFVRPMRAARRRSRECRSHLRINCRHHSTGQVRTMNKLQTTFCVAIAVAIWALPANAQSTAGAPGSVPPPAQTPAAPPRPTPPTREPNTPGYVTAKELPDGSVPSAEVDGNFIIGPTHAPAPETAVQDGVPQGTVYNFTMSSADSKMYPGIARDAGTFGTPDPADPAKLVVT